MAVETQSDLVRAQFSPRAGAYLASNMAAQDRPALAYLSLDDP